MNAIEPWTFVHTNLGNSLTDLNTVFINAGDLFHVKFIVCLISIGWIHKKVN